MKRSQSIFAFLIVCVIVGSALIARPVATGGVQSVFMAGPSQTPLPPTIQPTQGAAAPIPVPTAFPVDMTPIGPDGSPLPQGQAIPASDLQSSSDSQTQVAGASGTEAHWNPPPLAVPIAAGPWDHFWFIRPVKANHNNFALPDYSFGSNGAADDLRIHHGVDIANPIGVEVFAAADGTVLWSGKGSLEEDGLLTAYGQVIVIQHDFGYHGEPIFTLYAHLSDRLVHNGDRVKSGQIIGLVGNTGQVTGPHVHFEVRIGRNRYNDVYNPLLWMAPYDGTGVVAGRVLRSDGTPAYDSDIIVINSATGEVVFRTSSYAGPGVRSDEHWQETFVIPDLPEGKYLINARQEHGQWAGEVTVVAGTVNWVDMQPIASAPGGDTGTNQHETPTP